MVASMIRKRLDLYQKAGRIVEAGTVDEALRRMREAEDRMRKARNDDARKEAGKIQAEADNKLLSILPLRDRPADIQHLATFFTDRFSKEYGKDIGGLHKSALDRLESWQWPGNVSELRDVIENAVLLSRHMLIMDDDIRFNVSKKFIALESFLCHEDFFTLEEIEKIYIQTVLRRMKNNKSKTCFKRTIQSPKLNGFYLEVNLALVAHLIRGLDMQIDKIHGFQGVQGRRHGRRDALR